MEKFDRSVSLLCWAYNEEPNIAEYLAKVSSLLDSTVEDYEIVLVDDGSTDRTYDIAKTVQNHNARLKIFRNGKNLGSGISHRVAISNASKEFLFWQTVDWAYDISNLRQALEHLKTFDVIQGVRLGAVAGRSGPLYRLLHLVSTEHLKQRSDSVSKAFVSVVNYLLVRLLFRVPVSDFQNVTFYPTKWIQSVQFEARSAFANPEGLIKAYWSGMTIKEVSIGFIPRQRGVAKGTRFPAIRAAIFDIIRLWFSWTVLGKRGRITKGRVISLDSAR